MLFKINFSLRSLKFFTSTSHIISTSKFYSSASNEGTDEFLDSLKSISSVTNENFKFYKLLYDKKSKRDKENIIILESHRTILDALRNRMIPKSIFLTQSSIDSPLGLDLKNLIQQNEHIREVTYLVSDSLIEKISSLESSQGVISMFHHVKSKNLSDIESLALVCDR